jgi:hypothetical protein
VKRFPAAPFRSGQIGWRRDLTRHNAQDVAFVPLFVKSPGQRKGRVDDSWVRTVDILPTLLAAAHAKTAPRALAGRALGASGSRGVRPASLRVLTNRSGTHVLDPATLEHERAATIAARARRFGVGADVDRLFRIGPNAGLIGRSVRSFPALERSNVHARFWGARRFISVDRSGRHMPANVIGWLDGHLPAGRDLAVSVNGRIAAVGRSFKPIGALAMNFSLMVPESAFRNGFNDVRLYEVKRVRSALPGLRRLPTSPF